MVPFHSSIGGLVLRKKDVAELIRVIVLVHIFPKFQMI